MRNDAFIIGYGFVGKATGNALEIDRFFSLHNSNITLEEGSKKRFCLICLPTPTDDQGSQGKAVQVILDYIKQIQGYGGHPIYVIRSTVLPGTCKYLETETKEMIVSNPEFLSEATAQYDALHPRIKVIGANDINARREVIDLWQNIHSKITVETDLITSEMMKYVFNTFAAVKITFANQIYDACQRVGADYETIHDALHQHPWGSRHHFRVMDKGGRGAGGRCIPKDLKAFTKWSNSELLKKVEELNTKYLSESKKI